MPPTGDLVHNPGMCRDREQNWQSPDSQASSQSIEPHQPGPCVTFKIIKQNNLKCGNFSHLHYCILNSTLPIKFEIYQEMYLIPKYDSCKSHFISVSIVLTVKPGVPSCIWSQILSLGDNPSFFKRTTRFIDMQLYPNLK